MGKGFRFYTGVERTPVALAWMLRRRQRILGDIEAIERAVEAAPGKIAGLRKEREALETTIRMHEHPVDLDQIPPKRLRQAPKIKLPYGAIPKAVWKLLRESENTLCDWRVIRRHNVTMRIQVRRIGNSLGVVIPRSMLARWGLPVRIDPSVRVPIGDGPSTVAEGSQQNRAHRVAGVPCLAASGTTLAR